MKDKQYKLNIELDEYTKADHEYHIHVSAVINLSRRMGDIFEEAEPEEQRAILNYLLQNPKVSGKKLDFELKKPFSTVLELADCTTGLPKRVQNLPLSRFKRQSKGSPGAPPDGDGSVSDNPEIGENETNETL